MSNPGVKEMLALLDALKSAVRDFAAREEKLTGDFRTQTTAAARLLEDAAVRRMEKLGDAVEQEKAAFAGRKQQQQAAYEKRKARITQAHAAVRKRLLDEIGEQHGQTKYKIQESTLEAERRRDNALAETVVTLENFRLKTAEAAKNLEALTQRVRGALGGGILKRKWPEPDLTPDENQMFAQFEKLCRTIEDDLAQFHKVAAPKILRLVAGGQTKSLANAIGENWAKARRLLDAAAEKAEQRYQQDQQRLRAEYEATLVSLNQEWRAAEKGVIHLRGARPISKDEQAARIFQTHERQHRAALERLAKGHPAIIEQLNQAAELEEKKFVEAHAAKMAGLEADYQANWQKLETEWKSTIRAIYEKIHAANAAAEKDFPAWPSPSPGGTPPSPPAGERDGVRGHSDPWKNWTPPTNFINAAKFGRLEVEVPKFAEASTKDKRLALPEAKFSVPMSLGFPLGGSILFETNKGGEAEAVTAINNIIFRLLSATPPGKVNFTIFDPVGLGQNFAALMHLADYEEGYINSRIWTQQTQFEEKLAELNEHMEKVIQMYLRNEYATIADYNAQAGSIAEKYHFLVIASFPVNFSDLAARRLRNIAANGARCGVYTLIHWDQRNAPPNDFVPDEMRKNSVRLVRGDSNFSLANWREPGVRLTLDPAPPPEFATQFLHEVGASSKGSARVEVPFDQVAPPDGEIWSEQTTEELRVPIGRSGATKFQYLEIGKGTRQHALIAGKTGSGKSTLFHIIVTNLSLWCGPEEVEFYLVDFKKGVEFKCYASRHLPHARVVAIESDRAFGLSVLQRVDEELRRRGDLFRQLGVQDVPGYKRAVAATPPSPKSHAARGDEGVAATPPMPRCLLIIDEFQEFFTEEDRVSQGAAVLLDRIVRQGRAFGIHVLLGSQTLGGAYTLARATIGQMVIRIALMCNEADAFLIMDQDNPAPRLLTRPGEGIYNDSAGSIEGNSPFQAVWLPEEVRDNYLAKIRERADDKKFPGPFVFEGNAPADIRENLLLVELLKSWKTISLSAPGGRGEGRGEVREKQISQPRIWLGAPNSIKGPTEAVFVRQSGSNLLIVGQSEERETTLLVAALVALGAQFPKGAVRFVVFDSAPPGFPERDFLERVIRAVPHEIKLAGNANLAETMGALAEELKQRTADESAPAPETFLFIHGLPNFKKLRNEDEFSFSSGGSEGPNPAAILQSLIGEGAAHGIHVIATCDTYNNVNRFLGRKTLAEFEMRVLFQMSASDSASLVESPEASTLGLHRALYYNDREGYTEIFRPYARPDNEWIEEIARLLKGQ